ncbi:MAG: hypothetical protein C0524_11880 [Rhodobacter sp.]|nr:hypothetical protein [Rhodobacter sp.]
MTRNASSERSYAARLGALSWPIGIDLALLFTTFVTDSYFLSQLGDLPAGAVGALFPLFGLLAMILRQVAQAGSVVSAHLDGEGNQEAVALARRTTFWNGVGLGLGAGAILFATSAYVPRLLGLADEAALHATMYMAVMAPGVAFLSLKHTFAALHLSGQNSRPQMKAALLAVIVNAALNAAALEFFQHRLPVAQLVALIAGATVVAYAVNALVLWTLIPDRRALLQPPSGTGMLRRIWAKAVPTAIEPAAIQIQWLVISVLVASLGITALATRIYVLNIEMFVLTWSMSIAIAAQILTSYETGAGNEAGARAVVASANRIGAAGAALITLAMLTVSNLLIGVFTDDPAILSAARWMLLIAIPTEAAKAVYNTTCWALVARGDSRFPVLASLALLYGLGVPLAYALAMPAGLGVVGIWLALCIDETIRAAVMVLRWNAVTRLSSTVLDRPAGA